MKKDSWRERYDETLGSEAQYSGRYLYLPIEGRTIAIGRPFPNSRTASSAIAFVNVYVFGQSFNKLKSINIRISLIQPKSRVITLISNKTDTVSVHVTWRRIRVTTVAVEKQLLLHILSTCF